MIDLSGLSSEALETCSVDASRDLGPPWPTMYVHHVEIENLRCFAKARVEFVQPGERRPRDEALPNVTVLLGNNGTGKTTILKAVAMGALAPVLRDIGFVAKFMVRRAKTASGHGRVKAGIRFGIGDGVTPNIFGTGLPFIVELASTKGPSDRILKVDAPGPPPGVARKARRDHTNEAIWSELVHSHDPQGFLVLGYGSGRRMARPEMSDIELPLRNRRVAGLFDEHVPLSPISHWLPRQNAGRTTQVANILDSLLEEHGVKVDRKRIAHEGGPFFIVRESSLALEALSDGFRGFVSWVSDLLKHVTEATPSGKKLRDVAGVVLVDEVDLLLHPAWQKTVVPALSRAFPALQFVVTTHSPLVASSVSSFNIRMMIPNDDNTVGVAVPNEETWGKTADQILTSPLFGLTTTRPPRASRQLSALASKAQRARSPDAVEDLLRALATTPALASPSPSAPSSGSTTRRVARGRSPAKSKTKKRPKAKAKPKAALQKRERLM